MADGHGGVRPGSGRWSNDELEALRRGDSDDLISRIKGRSFANIQAKRAALEAGELDKPKKRKRRKKDKITKEKEVTETVAAEPKKREGLSEMMLERLVHASTAMKRKQSFRSEFNPFKPAVHPPAATPPKKYQMAMDQGGVGWAYNNWGTGAIGEFLAATGAEGLFFLGYPFLSELAQRAEYRQVSETPADDATRKWIDFEVVGGGDEEDQAVTYDPDERKKKIESAGKMDKVKALKDEMERLELRDRFYSVARDDGFYGRSHLFMDFGADLDDVQGELGSDIGNGRDETSKKKVEKGSLRRLKVIEPIWIYPTTYNAINPLKEDWYNPSMWYVMGRNVHCSRMPVFIGRPVPDILKPAYSFGGLSLSQMAKPYVDIWLKTRESIGELIHAFSVMVLATDMQTILQGGGIESLMTRLAAFNALRDNQGTFAINKATEEFSNVSVPLGGLHELQAQALEHIATVSRIPLVKLTGISPSGLNACLTGDTLIETDQGQVPIRDIHTNQKVMTRSGWAPIAKAGCTGYATELIEIETAETMIRCTAEHRIWLSSKNAFIPAVIVRRGDSLLYRDAIDSQSVVLSVRRVPAQEFVYDIQVASGYLPEFFANGICVHNSSEGELRAYYDTIAAYQNRFFRPNLTKVLNFIQLSLWGEVDPEITFIFEPLWEMSQKEKSEKEKDDAERDQKYVDMGAFSPGEIRKIKIEDPTLPYTDMDPEDTPDLRSEEEAGLVPAGAGRAVEGLLEEGPEAGGGQAAKASGGAGRQNGGNHRYDRAGSVNPEKFADETAQQRYYDQMKRRGAVNVDAASTRTVMIIRHGATNLNDEDVSVDRIRGWTDVPLSDAGEKEAERLGRELMNRDELPQVLVTSDLKRARNTAKIISKITGIEIAEVSKSFRPWDVGEYAGELSNVAIPIIGNYAVNKPDEKIPGGESFNSFRQRFLAGLKEALAKYDGLVAIVTHHRDERLLKAWEKAGFPDDGGVDEKEFDRQGEHTGSMTEIEIPLTKLATAKAVDTHKPTEVAADTASALNGLAKRILAESHPSGANDQQTVSEDDIKNERLVAALGDPAVSSTDWLDQLRARIAEVSD